MAIVTIIVIALGLAMDAFAVSIVSGGVYKVLNIKHCFQNRPFLRCLSGLYASRRSTRRYFYKNLHCRLRPLGCLRAFIFRGGKADI